MTATATPNGNGNGNGHAPAINAEQLKRLDEKMEALVGNALMARQEWFRKLMDPRRDIDKECGYAVGWVPHQVYQDLFDRDAIAARVVEVYPKETWQVTPSIYESEDSEEITPFEEAWDALGDQLRGEQSYYQDQEGNPVWEYLCRTDILSGIGQYGVLLIGIDDGLDLREPAELKERSSMFKPGASKKLGDKKPFDKLAGKKKSPFASAGDDEEEEEEESIPSQLEKKRKAGAKPSLNAGPPKFGKRPGAPSPNGKHPSAPQNGKYAEEEEEEEEDTEEQQPYPQKRGAAFGGEEEEDGLAPQEFDDEGNLLPAPMKMAPPPKHKLLYLRVFPEAQAEITQFEQDQTSPRFGQPVMYNITFTDPREQHAGVGLAMTTQQVHWTRIIHVADNLNSSEVFGVQRMRPVLNRLYDLQKLYGGSAEMYWRGGFPGLSFETHPQLGGDVLINQQEMRDTYENYINGLQRALFTTGMTVKTLAPTVADPTSQIEVQLTAICIKLAIPKRVFMGSERGELASSQDDAAWNDRLKHRQKAYVTPRVIVPFVDRLIALDILPEPSGWSAEWPDLTSQTEEQQATIANIRTVALTQFIAGGGEQFMTQLDYLTLVWKMEEEEALVIIENVKKHLEEKEIEDMAKQEDLISRGLAPDPTDPEQMMLAGPDGSIAKQPLPFGGGPKPGGPPPGIGGPPGKPSGGGGGGSPFAKKKPGEPTGNQWYSSESNSTALVPTNHKESAMIDMTVTNDGWQPFAPAVLTLHGGPGSGNFGHAGRPGLHGGSASGGPRGGAGPGATGGGKKYKPLNPKGKDTMHRHSTGPNEDERTWTPARAKLHTSIIKKAMKGKTPVKNPIGYIMGGGPASGKSTIIKSKRNPGGLVVFDKNTVHIDPDAIKGALPEYNSMVRNRNKKAAAFAHSESSLVSKVLESAGRDGSYNTMLDGVGNNTIDKLEKKINKMKASGQRVVANYVTVDTNEAVRRSIARAKKTGRFVPLSILREAHSNVSKVVPEAIKRGLYDDFTLWDTNVEGAPATRVASAQGKKLVIHDQKAWDRFTSKAGEFDAQKARYAEIAAKRRTQRSSMPQRAAASRR